MTKFTEQFRERKQDWPGWENFDICFRVTFGD